MSARLCGERPRRVSTRCGAYSGNREGTDSATKPSGAKLSAVSRASWFTPARLVVKLLRRTMRSRQRHTAIDAAHGISDPAELARVDATLYYTADQGIQLGELWSSNGTPSGTEPVSNNDGAIFQSDDSGTGKLNLTSNGTTLAFTA